MAGGRPRAVLRLPDLLPPGKRCMTLSAPCAPAWRQRAFRYAKLVCPINVGGTHHAAVASMWTR